MNYLKLPYVDSPVNVFDICQAHRQLEADYNVGGWLRERPSNQRRDESTAFQLYRMKFHAPHRWVDIMNPNEEDRDVSDIYLINVMKLGLPRTAQTQAYIDSRFTPEFVKEVSVWHSPSA